MIGTLAICGTKARLAGDDNFVVLHHHKKAHGFFLDPPKLQPGLVFTMLTALQEFEMRLLCAAREEHRGRPSPIGRDARDLE
jgi:hypothetical protein